jgi:aspartyl protease family protein
MRQALPFLAPPSPWQAKACRRLFCRILCCFCLLLALPGAKAQEARLLGIEDGRALFSIDGVRQQPLAVGQSAGSMRLVSLSGQGAVVEISGRRKFIPVQGNWQTAARPPETPARPAAVLRLKRSAGDGRFYAEGTINGAMTRFLVDTGAAKGVGLVMTRAEARRIGLDLSRGRPTVLYGSTGEATALKLICREVEIGGKITLRNAPCAVEDSVHKQPFVLLGMDVLQHLSMHYEGDDLLLSAKAEGEAQAKPAAPPDTPKAIVLHKAQDGRFYAKGKIDGIPARFLVDTGASGGVAMGLRQARQLGIDVRSWQPAYHVRKPGGEGVLPIWKTVLDTVEIGGEAVHQVECTIGWDMDDMLVGTDFLQRFYVRREGDRLILKRRF